MLSRTLTVRFFCTVPSYGTVSSRGHNFFSVLGSSTMQKNEKLSSSSNVQSLMVDSSLLIPREDTLLDRNTLKDVVIAPFGSLQSQAVGVFSGEVVNRGRDSVDELHELLMLCVKAPSVDLYEKLIISSNKLYMALPTRYWSFYSRVLVNYGVQCFVDRKTFQAVELLRKAVEIVTLFDGETAVLHLRVFLANALTCEGQCFAALCEYEKVLEVMRDYPVETPLLQVVSGKDSHNPLSRSYVLEDFDHFLADEKVVKCALDQGCRELHCCSEGAKKVWLTLVMARLRRRIGEKDASLALYTAALRILLDSPSDVDMEIRVMHDVGLLLCFEVFDVTQGLPYLQAASEMSFNCALQEVEKNQRLHGAEAQKTTSLSSFVSLSEGVLRIRRAAFALLDTAVCFAENEEMDKALGLFEESVSLMNTCGMQNHSAWARMRYADALAQASLVDKAISVYLEAIEIIQSVGQGSENLQMACMGMVIPLTVAEIEGRLAHCFQVHVGEYRRACVHFWQALRRCGITLRSPFTCGEKMTTISFEEVDSETVCWMLENYASCCERVGNIDIAEEVLERRVDIEKALGGSCSSALLRLAQLHGANNIAKSVWFYVQLLRLPDDAIEPDVLLQAAYGFAGACYASNDEDLASALANASSLSPSSSLLTNRDEVKSSTRALANDSAFAGPNATVIESFKKAASVIMASHAVDALRSSGDGDEELKALMTLSRGGYFCQRRGDEAGAEELYRLAVEYTLLARIDGEEYSRELAIMFANYATVIAHKDVQKAQELYNKAVVTCPSEESVLSAAVSFFVLTCNYTDGRKCVERMIETATDDAALPQLYGKLAWLGIVCWDGLTPAARFECLQHLLFGLKNSCLAIADSSESFFGGVISDDLKHHFLCGISTSQDQETVSLATYVAQTKLPHDGKFINACYKAALVRFPQSTTMLVNYAKFCADYGAVTLARKYYAAAFCYSRDDLRSSECYAEYLAFLRKEGHQEQVVVGECLARYEAERSLCNSNALLQAQASALYGKYLATFLPSPGTPVLFFEAAIKRNPTDAGTMAIYGSFLWNVCARSPIVEQTPNARKLIAAKVEELYVGGLMHQPQSVPLLTALGALYLDTADRFSDAVCVLERARKLSPHNPAVNRLLCAAFHDEFAREETRVAGGAGGVRLRSLLETTQRMYEAALQLEPLDPLVLARYCHFALNGLHNTQLAGEIMRRLRELQKEE